MGGKLMTGVGFWRSSRPAHRRKILKGERFPSAPTLPQAFRSKQTRAPPRRSGNQNGDLARAQTGGDWTHRAGNARHLMPHAALSATPQRVWSAKIGAGSSRKNRISAAPVVADGRVFTIDAGTAVTATGTNGATLWSTDLTASFDKGGEQSAVARRRGNHLRHHRLWRAGG
jgi:hypothetical protein